MPEFKYDTCLGIFPRITANLISKKKPGYKTGPSAQIRAEMPVDTQPAQGQENQDPQLNASGFTPIHNPHDDYYEEPPIPALALPPTHGKAPKPRPAYVLSHFRKSRLIYKKKK